MEKFKQLVTDNNRIKNSMSQEVELPQDLDLLNKWTIPKVKTNTIYQIGVFDRLPWKQVVKTTEESISLNNEEMFLKLFNNHDIEPYRRQGYKYIHIGLVQVAFKPLTLEGLPESFIAALRDGRNLDYKKSLMGLIKTSLAYGPVYFDVYPNLQLSLTDENILDALSLDVKTHGYNYAQGSEVMCVCYRIYYKPLYTLNPHCKIQDKKLNETMLITTNFNKSDITIRDKIRWDDITYPESWTMRKVTPSQPIIHTSLDLLNIKQTAEGSVTLNFNNNRNNRLVGDSSRHTRSNSTRSFISPLDYRVELPRSSTSQIKEPSRIEEEEESLYKEPIISAIRTTTPSIVEELRNHRDNILRTHHRSRSETMSQMSYDFNDV